MLRVPLRSLAALSLLWAAGAAHAATTWVATATKAVPIVNATLVGPMPAEMPVHIVVGLKMRNGAQLADFIRSLHTPGSPAFGHYLSTSQFVSSYSPSAADAQAVADYLRSQGFRNISIKPNRLIVSAAGTAAMAQAAFNTALTVYTRNSNGEAFYVNTLDAAVPSALGNIVSGVMGLNNFRISNRNIGPPGQPQTLIDRGYAPQDFWKAYGADTSPTGNGTTVAVFVDGNSGPAMIPSLHRFDDEFHLPAVWAKTTIVEAIDPGQAMDPAGGLGEWDMDAQTSTGMAGDVSQLYIYESATAVITDSTISFNRFVTDNVAKAGSASFSFCEGLGSVLVGWNVITDPVFAQAAAQGQTVFASSGDTGPTCPAPVVGSFANGVPNGGVPLQQNYPASSPFVVAVGGTTLMLNPDGTYDFETAWDAGGGGPSFFEPAPDWQLNKTPTSPISNQDPLGIVSLANGLYNDFWWGGPPPGDPYPDSYDSSQFLSVVGKGVPDVAMDADFVASPGAYDSACASPTDMNCQTSNGGTSLASPLAMGAWARVQGAAKARTGKCYGFASPLLYAMTPGLGQAAAGFNDVILGTNGLWPATPGWDYTTGLGSFNVGALIAALPAPTEICAGGSSGGGNTSPTAVLVATSPTSGPQTLTVQFDGTGSSDDDVGDSVAQYKFHFGDGTPDVTQASGLVSHSYVNAGSFVASLVVTDSQGATSAPASLPVVVTPSYTANPAACTLPGVGLLTDASVDNLAPLPGTDLLSVSIASPYAATPADQRIVFTINTDPGRAMQPLGSGWYVSFPHPHDNTVRGVRMIFDKTSPSFQSYVASGAANNGGTDGRFADPATIIAADPNSNYDQKAGRITIIVKPGDLGLVAGDVIAGFNAASTFTNDSQNLGVGFTETFDQIPDSLAYESGFAVYGNTFCPPAASPIARVTPTSLKFADRVVGSGKSDAQTVTYTNTWTQALPMGPYVMASTQSTIDFVEMHDCPSSLPVGASCHLNVQFRPTATGLRTGTLTIVSNNGRRTDTVSLSGTGLAPTLP